MIKLILLIISVILFALAALGIGVGSIHTTAWGWFFFAASFLPFKE